MSLVGTRPPTLDEWEKYEPHHRARMSFRPGLTGLWQVSGRSNITDLSRDFISVDECLLFCKLIKDLSVPALMFLKKNVHKSVLYHITEENFFLIKELKQRLLQLINI